MRQVLIFISFCLFTTLNSCSRNLNCEAINKDYFSLISALKEKSDTIDFLKKIDRLIQSNPSCAKAYEVRVKFSIEQGDFLRLKSDLANAIRYDSTSVYSLYTMAYIFNIQEMNDSALMFINRAIYAKETFLEGMDSNDFFSTKFDIPFGELLFLRGSIYLEMKYFTRAKKDFLFVEERKYSLGEVNYALSEVYLNLGVPDSARDYYLKARNLGFGNPKLDSLFKSKGE